MDFETYGTAISSALTISTLFLLLFSLISLALIIFSNKGMFDTAEFKAKYGTFLRNHNTKGFTGTYWSIIQQIRWIITMVIIIFARDYYFIQLMTLILISGAL